MLAFGCWTLLSATWSPSSTSAVFEAQRILAYLGVVLLALLVVNKKSYAWVDLRADEHDEPVGELRRLYGLYIPLIPYYDNRPSNPSMPRDDDWRKQTGVKGGPR